MKKIIALTGGIGSGKSTALDLCKTLGYVTVSCDEISKTIYFEEKVKNQIKSAFGEGVFTGGEIDRKKLSDFVFGNSERVKKLNGITHGFIMEKALKLAREGDGDAVVEVPLLFEGGFENLFDKVIIIMRDKSARVKSVMDRSGLTENEVLLRIKNQFDYENLGKTAHTVIYNDGSVEELSAKLRCELGEKTS